MEKEKDVESTFAFIQTLFQAQSVWIYRIPPSQISSMAPRADNWNPDEPLMTGSLVIIQSGDECYIKVFEPFNPHEKDHEKSYTNSTIQETKDGLNTNILHGKLLAQCPIRITNELGLEVYVQDCTDSSRYFMLRMEDEHTGRNAYIGIGFQERDQAFNFKASLQDYVKYSRRLLQVATSGKSTLANDSIVNEKEENQATTSAYSLPKGATIHINFKGKSVKDEKAVKKQGHSSQNISKIPFLPPPPGDTIVKKTIEDVGENNTDTKLETNNIQDFGEDEEEWGDFTTSG